MNTNRKPVTLLVTLGFVLSVLAVFAPIGAAAGRVENFVVAVTFTNPDDSQDNSSGWMEGATVNITANVSIASGMDNVTELALELAVSGNMVGSPQSLGALNAGEYKEYTWNWLPPGYGDYTIMVTAVNGTDNANQTVKTLYYKSLDSDISITAVEASPAVALIGVDEVTVTASLSNNGNMDEMANVSFKLDGTMDLGFVAELSVPAGGSADAVLTTKFAGLTIADGNHTVTATMTDLSETSVTSDNITLSNPVANVTIDDLKVAPASGYVGDVVTFTVTLTNSGTADAVNITVDFAELVILIYLSIGELNVTVPKGSTVNATWTYALPEIDTATETKTIRAGYGEGFFLTTYKTVNVTINKKLPKLEVTAFSMPAGKRAHDDVVVNITVKNNGTANATGVVVKLRQGGWEYTNVTVPFNLSVGESKTVALGIDLNDEPEDGNQTYTAVAVVGGVEATKDSTIFVAHQIWAAIGIQAFKISPAKKDNQPKDSSQSFSGTVTLKNSGEKAGSVQLMLYEGTGTNAKLLYNQSVSVDGSASKDVKVSFKVKGSGKHTITAVVGLPNYDPGNMTKAATCELQYSSPGFEVAVLVSAILIAAVIIRRRKN